MPIHTKAERAKAQKGRQKPGRRNKARTGLKKKLKSKIRKAIIGI